MFFFSIKHISQSATMEFDEKSSTAPSTIECNANNFVSISENIDVMRTIDLVKDDSAGAISTFMGTTRDNFEGMKIL